MGINAMKLLFNKSLGSKSKNIFRSNNVSVKKTLDIKNKEQVNNQDLFNIKGQKIKRIFLDKEINPERLQIVDEMLSALKKNKKMDSNTKRSFIKDLELYKKDGLHPYDNIADTVEKRKTLKLTERKIDKYINTKQTIKQQRYDAADQLLNHAKQTADATLYGKTSAIKGLELYKNKLLNPDVVLGKSDKKLRDTAQKLVESLISKQSQEIPPHSE